MPPKIGAEWATVRETEGQRTLVLFFVSAKATRVRTMPSIKHRYLQLMSRHFSGCHYDQGEGTGVPPQQVTVHVPIPARKGFQSPAIIIKHTLR